MFVVLWILALNVRWGRGAGWTLLFLTTTNPTFTLVMVIPLEIKNGNLVKASQPQDNEFRRILWQGLPAALPADCIGWWSNCCMEIVLWLLWESEWDHAWVSTLSAIKNDFICMSQSLSWFLCCFHKQRLPSEIKPTLIKHPFHASPLLSSHILYAFITISGKKLTLKKIHLILSVINLYFDNIEEEFLHVMTYLFIISLLWTPVTA